MISLKTLALALAVLILQGGTGYKLETHYPVPGNGGSVDLSESFYDEAQDVWVLTRNGKVVTKSRSVVNSGDPCERVETRIDQDGDTTKKTIKVYRGFAWGQELVKEIEDADGQALTTITTFYEDPTRAHYGHVKTMTLPNGRVLHRFIPEYPQ